MIKKDKKTKIFKIILEFIVLFIIVFSVLYLVFNFSSIFSRIKYKFFKDEKLNIELIEKELAAQSNEKKIQIKDTLIIPKLNIQVPIFFSEKEENIENDLLRGVSHHPSTSKPGENGNILISGHSSNYFWERGDYNSVFANLSELDDNDELFVYYKSKRYDYKVFENKVLSLEQSKEEIFREEKKSIMNLVTCWPTGTTWKRLVVKANLN